MGKKCVYMTGGSFCRFITVPPFDDTSYNQIEAQILTFFNRSDIVTPDEVRGSYSTLEFLRSYRLVVPKFLTFAPPAVSHINVLLSCGD